MDAFSIEAAAVAWLQTLGYDAAQMMQAEKTGVFVTVERTGGGVVNLVDYPELAFQVWADTNAEAEAAAQGLRLALLTGAPPDGVHSWQVNAGPYLFPDYEAERPRYQIVVDAACQLTE